MRPVRLLLEAFSAFFVVTALLALIYSGVPWIRAVAGIALVVLVSTLTASLVLRHDRRRSASRKGDE